MGLLKKSLCAAVLSVISFTAFAADLVFDGSSSEAFEESGKKIGDSLDDDGKKIMGDALGILAQEGFSMEDMIVIAAAGDKADALVQEKIRKQLNGMSGKDMVKSAKTVVDTKVSAIKDKADGYLKSKDQLGKIELSDVKFSTKTPPSADRPVAQIDLAIKNGTDKALSKIYFQGELKTPGRSVAWLKEKVDHEIKGGLEPGETVKWKIQPNMFSWDMKDAPKDLELSTFTVLRVDGADGKVLWDATMEGEEDPAKLLESLQAKSESFDKFLSK